MTIKEFISAQENIARKLKIEFGADRYKIKYTEIFYIEFGKNISVPTSVIPNSKVEVIKGNDKNRIEVEMILMFPKDISCKRKRICDRAEKLLKTNIESKGEGNFIVFTYFKNPAQFKKTSK